MDNTNVLELMAQYDFNSPFKVTLIFEDSDDDLQILEENEQKDSDTDNNIKDAATAYKEKERLLSEIEIPQSETNSQIKIKDSNEALRLNGTVKELQNDKPSVDISKQSNEKEKGLEKNSPNGEGEITSSTSIEPGNQRDTVSHPSYGHPPHITFEALNEVRQSEKQVAHHNYTREPAALLNNLLNTLSEYLITVMHAYYRYGINKNIYDRLDYEERRKAYTLIKHHFFELSYNTVISIIVPQEQNTIFINSFLENTVKIANSTSRKWKCHKGHLEPFFNEILTWTRNKRGLIRRVSSVLSPDENYHLKQHLSKPLQTINRTQNISNNVCIFSSGSLGVEINVNPDTLINCNEKQYNYTVEWNGVQNQNNQIGSESRIISKASENQTNVYTKNHNSKHHRRLTPYSVVQNSISNENIEHPLHEIQAKRRHSNIKNSTTQRQTNNQTDITSPFNSGNKNAVNNKVYNNQMLILNSQTVNEASNIQKPVISNVISLNPNAQSTIEGRCCVCGKATLILCSKCNKPSYCSVLCQEISAAVCRP